MHTRFTLSLLLAAGVAGAAIAHDDGCCLRLPAAAYNPFDPATGRDLLNYARHRHVDHQHMKLVIDIPDMNVPRATAVQTLTVNAIGTPVETLTLDARLLEIAGVSSPGREVAHEHDGQHLTIRFDPPLQPGAPADIVTRYTINDPPDGLFWTPESDAWPGRAAQIHTQGQPESNRYWFPSHDYPNDRLTTELIVTVPAGFVVSGNGRLESHQKGGGPGARETFHWVQDKPHVNYLVSLIVGKFDIVDVADHFAHRNAPRPLKRMPMPVYVPPGRGPDVVPTYGRTAEMVGLFERLIGEAYPWDRYAQLVVWNFGAGGMENTSATTMYDTAIFSGAGLLDEDLDGLIAHELAHQWFGDLITCRTWEHIWLNEGFATYFTALWFEHRSGKDEYHAAMLGSFDGCRSGDRSEAPDQWAMVRKQYANSWDVFGGPNSPYPRGASILHMLRMRLGDDVFFRSIAEYTRRFRYKQVETNDFRRVLEDVSGESLEQFFDQWVMRPGMPDLDIDLEWDRNAGELVVSVKQTQRIDGYNPAYEFDLPLQIKCLPVRSGQGREAAAPLTVWRMLEVRGREAAARFRLPAPPAFVAVDPQLTVLSRNSIDQGADRWAAQLAEGSTLPARIAAARALGAEKDAASRDALVRAAFDPIGHEKLRAEAVVALKNRGEAAALLRMAVTDVRPSAVRVALIESIADLAAGGSTPEEHRSGLREVLIAHASADWSEKTRAAAIRGLGRIGAQDQLSLISRALDAHSQHDRVRQAALDALADLNAPGTLAQAARFTLPGTLGRTRPVAMNAVRRLALQDRETAFQVLALNLRDRERRAWEAAGRALVALGDQRAVGEFESLIDEKRDPADRARVRGWIEELRGKATAAR
jgi:aminopeptidase N